MAGVYQAIYFTGSLMKRPNNRQVIGLFSTIELTF